jgi:hypothetical protein
MHTGCIPGAPRGSGRARLSTRSQPTRLCQRGVKQHSRLLATISEVTPDCLLQEHQEQSGERSPRDASIPESRNADPRRAGCRRGTPASATVVRPAEKLGFTAEARASPLAALHSRCLRSDAGRPEKHQCVCVSSWLMLRTTFKRAAAHGGLLDRPDCVRVGTAPAGRGAVAVLLA